MKKKLLLFLCSLLFLLHALPVHAEPRNNKFGISLLQPSNEDIREAAAIVNGNGGSWGYITLVIQENDRDIRKWQDVFDELRTNKLVPIVRLATKPEGKVWRVPSADDINQWIEFLNKLNWVVKERYIILFNEPNHATEWGGAVSPKAFGEVCLAFAEGLVKSNSDYVVMLGGLDGAAPQYGDQYWDSLLFLSQMCADISCTNLFKYVRAWSSHSYPNPGFAGPVWDTGKKSVRGYEIELVHLESLGIRKDLPVFITETGWDALKLSDVQIAENIRAAYRDIWGSDNRVRAVTPFVFKYESPPFSGFSWWRNGTRTPQAQVVAAMEKESGSPDQHQQGTLGFRLPHRLLIDSTYHMVIRVKNSGQAIWDSKDGYEYELENEDGEKLSAMAQPIQEIKPFEEEQVSLYLKTPSTTGTFSVRLFLKKNKETILASEVQRGAVEPLPSITAHASLFPKLVSNGDGLEVQIFNAEEELVFKKSGLSLRKGLLHIEHIANIVPGDTYRVVLLGYPYIPRQEIITFQKGENTVSMKRMFPFDVDGNGTWGLNDVWELVTHPGFLLRFVPWGKE